MKKPVWKADWMIGLLVTMTFMALSETTYLRSLDWFAYDLGMRFVTETPTNDDIVIVAIDDKSLAELGSWPWSRELIAEGTRVLAKSRPRVIGYTLGFDSPENSRDLEALAELKQVLKTQKVLRRKVRNALKNAEASLDTDQKLASAFQNGGRIVLSMPYLERDDPATPANGFLPGYLRRFTLDNTPTNNLPMAGSIYAPIETLAKQVSGVGALDRRLDSSGAVRQQSLVVQYGEAYLPSFSLMLAARHLGLSPQNISISFDKPMQLGNKSIDTDRSLSVYPRFYQSESDNPAFNAFSFVDVLNGNIAESEFRRKTIIIGITATQQVVGKMTPLGELMSPTLIAAHTVSSLLDEETFHLPEWAPTVQKIAILIIGLYLMFIMVRLRQTTSFFVSIFLLLIIANAHFILMSTKSTWLPMMAAIMSLVVGHLILSARKTVDTHVSAVRRALFEANRQLAQSFQSQGQLDQAFDKLKQCEVDDNLLGQMYNLGLDYERKRQFNKAVTVFELIKKHRSRYNDVGDRIKRNKKASNAVVLGGSASTNANATLILEKSGMQKPTLGRYRIDKEIGRGAMGMVYSGRDDKIGRTVAIKTMVLSDEIEPDRRDEVKKRFFREAEAAGRLDHPNIVTVYDVGDEQELAYIAMDFLKGKDLTAYCKKKSLLPVTDVFDIIMDVAKALDYAHQQHVVHRDIKPANIIYDAKKRTAKITDFGVACLTDASKTKTGTVLGSPYYMSPEQLAGKKVDGRSDLFSLGVTFYQMLAGELPFTSESMANLMYKIANEKHPDIRSYRPELASCVNSIINRALHKDAAKRYQTGEQMAAAMKRCQDRATE